MRRSLVLALATLTLAGCASRQGRERTGTATGSEAEGAAAPYTIAYTIAMPDPASHLYHVTIDVADMRGAPLELHLPVWSPGRYARMDFARNVQDFSATGPDGAPLRWEKVAGSRWRVAPSTRARVRYRVFANDLSGTFSVLDTLHANWNGAGVFMYVVGHKPDPVTLRVEAPAGWQLMNGEARDVTQRDFRFANYDILVDTPTEIAPRLDVDSFRVDGIVYRVVTHHNGDQQGQRARFVRDHQRIVTYQNRVFGPPPIPMYTVLHNVGFPGGDGMEHLNSTQVIDRRRWTADSVPVLPGIGTASHEYFHVWNVKRMRPAALGPFDYTQSIHQPSLWVAEGWTNYYGTIALHRAGILDRAGIYDETAELIRVNLEHPGRKERSARQASFDAPFFDGGAAPMRTNAASTFFTYYVKGEGLALALDLMIRARTAGARSLDDVARLLRDRTWHAPTTTYYLQGRGYTEEDVERAASEVAGTDLRDWFARHVGGTEDVDYRALLAPYRLTYTASGEGTTRRYHLTEVPNATPAQLRLREGWLTGR